jgi:hypothetical protein
MDRERSRWKCNGHKPTHRPRHVPGNAPPELPGGSGSNPTIVKFAPAGPRYDESSPEFSSAAMNPTTAPASWNPGEPDRRRYTQLREIFDEAYERISPFFAKENRWGNATLDHLAYRVVRENYPQLSFDEVHVLVVACHRVYSELEAERATSK